MLISRRTRDKSIPWDNMLKRTTGFYGHLPKFWSCKNYNFTYRRNEFDTDDFIEKMETFYRGQEAAHQSCILKRHMSYAGYFRYVGRKHIFTLWYMGNPYRPGKILEHGTKRVDIAF